jgi:uncharacterized RDD family membrane protein YckC
MRPSRGEDDEAPRYAGLVSRSASLAVDAAVIGGGTCGGAVVMELVGVILGVWPRDLAHAVLWLSVVALPALTVCYTTVFAAVAGRTPGMALLGIRVVPTHGRWVSWGAALIRAVVMVLLPLGILWCVVDRRGQAVHDKLARTLVVYDRRSYGGRDAAGPPGSRVAADSQTSRGRGREWAMNEVPDRE